MGHYDQLKQLTQEMKSATHGTHSRSNWKDQLKLIKEGSSPVWVAGHYNSEWVGEHEAGKTGWMWMRVNISFVRDRL